MGALQDDLIFLPSKVSSSMGHLGPLVLCTRAMNTLHFMEPYTMRSTQVEVNVVIWHACRIAKKECTCNQE